MNTGLNVLFSEPGIHHRHVNYTYIISESENHSDGISRDFLDLFSFFAPLQPPLHSLHALAFGNVGNLMELCRSVSPTQVLSGCYQLVCLKMTQMKDSQHLSQGNTAKHQRQ